MKFNFKIYVIITIFFIFLLGLLPGIFFGIDAYFKNLVSITLTLQLTIILVVFCVSAFVKLNDLFIVTTIYQYVWLTFVPMGNIATNTYSLMVVHNQHHELISTILSLCSYIVFLCLTLTINFKPKNKKFFFNIINYRLYIITFYNIIITLIFVNLFGTESFFILRNHFTSIIFNLFGQAGGMLFITLLRVPSFVTVLYIIYYRNSFKNNLKSWTFFISNFIVFLLFNNPMVVPRYWLGSILISFAFIFLNQYKQRILFYYSLVLVLIIIFPFSDLFRHEYIKYDEISFDSVSKMLLEKGDYDSFQQINNIVYFVENNSVAYGKNIYGAFFGFLPRSMWNNKPYGTGMIVAEWLGYRFTNLSAPLWGEAYFAFSYFGIIFIPVIYICFVILLVRRIRLNMLYPFLVGYQFFILRGDLLSSLTYLLPVAFMIYLMHGKNKY